MLTPSIVSRIVDLASSVPTLASLFGRLDLMMLGVRVRIPRYVWNVAKPRGGTRSGEGCRRGHRKNTDQSESSDKKLVHDNSPLSWWIGTTLRRLSANWALLSHVLIKIATAGFLIRSRPTELRWAKSIKNREVRNACGIGISYGPRHLELLLWMLDDIQQVGTEPLSARDKIVCNLPRNVGLRGARTIRPRFLCCSLTRDSPLRCNSDVRRGRFARSRECWRTAEAQADANVRSGLILNRLLPVTNTL